MIIYFDNVQYDLSDYVDTNSISVTKTADKTFDRANFSIPRIPSDFDETLDMSRPLPRNARCKFYIDEIEHNFIISTDNVTQFIGLNEYKHEVELTSPTRLLMESFNTSYSVRQPQGNYGLFYRTISNISAKVEVEPSVTLTYSTNVQSNDTDFLENRTMKETALFKIVVNLELLNGDATDHDMTINIKVGGSTVYSEDVVALRANLWEILTIQQHVTNVSITYEYNNSGSNEVTIEVVDNEYDAGGVQIEVNSAPLYIYGYDEVYGTDVTLDYIVNKILWDGLNFQEFVLDSTSEAKLSQFISRKWNLPAGDKWTQLNYIADQIKAYITTEYETTSNPRIIVKFILFDDLDSEQTPPTNDYHSKQATVDEYAKGLALDADNTVYTNGWQYEEGTLKTEGNEQLTTENIKIVLNNKIETIFQAEINYGKEITDGTNTYPSTTWFDVTDLIIDKVLYDTYTDFVAYTLVDRQAPNRKCSHLYTQRGSNEIGGLNYSGVKASEVIGSGNRNRALYEMIFSYLTALNGINVTTYDAGLTDDLNVRWRIKYKPQGSTNAVIYKDDETGFQANVIRKVNVEQSINEAEALGDYVDSMAQRNGGTVYSYGGTNRLSELPTIASKYDGKLLIAISYKVISDDLVSWSLTYVKDYVAISSYEGYDSRKRLYQIDADDVVKRVDRWDNKIILSESAPTEYMGVINPLRILYHLKATRTPYNPPKLANMTFIDASSGEYDISAWVKAQVLGKTLEWRIEMLNNFSAGFKIYEAEAGKWFNQYVPYTDSLGRNDNTLIELYEDTLSPSKADMQAFPEQIDGSEYVMTVNYNTRKDGAEWWNLSLQFHATSDSNNILIYEGLMKYTDMTNNVHDNYVPKVAELDYTPDRNSKLIDLTRATVTASEVVFTDVDGYKGYMTVTHSNSKPIAVYDENSLELLLVDLRETTSHVIHYYIEENSYGEYDFLLLNGLLGFERTYTYELAESDTLDLSGLLGLHVVYGNDDNYQDSLTLSAVLGFEPSFDSESHEVGTIELGGLLGFAESHITEENEQDSLTLSGLMGLEISYLGEQIQSTTISLSGKLGLTFAYFTGNAYIDTLALNGLINLVISYASSATQTDTLALSGALGFTTNYLTSPTQSDTLSLGGSLGLTINYLATPTVIQTATPTIYWISLGGVIQYRVRNNDASSATIKSDIGVNPPTTSRGVISPGNYTSYINTGQFQGSATGTVYATAQASGESVSVVASLDLSTL